MVKPQDSSHQLEIKGDRDERVHDEGKCGSRLCFFHSSLTFFCFFCF